MAKKYQAPVFARFGNVITTFLLRSGFKLVGMGSYPMYLFTVRGRKSGKPRTISIAIIERDGKRYLGSPFGIVAWVRNLRTAGEGILTRARRSETVKAIELPPREAALVLQADVKDGNPFSSYYGVTKNSSLEEFERAVVTHPLFLFQSAAQ